MCFWLLATRKRLTRRPREIIEPLRSVFPSRNAGKTTTLHTKLYWKHHSNRSDGQENMFF